MIRLVGGKQRRDIGEVMKRVLEDHANGKKRHVITRHTDRRQMGGTRLIKVTKSSQNPDDLASMGAALGVYASDEPEEAQMVVSVEVGEAPTKGETRVRRHPLAVSHLRELPFEDEPDVNTLNKILERSTFHSPKNSFLGSRTVLPDGKRGNFQWRSYETVSQEVAAVAGYLAAHWKKQTPIGIFSINREEWVVTQWAVWRQGQVCVPLYDTLGAGAIVYICNHTELSIVFASGPSVDKLLKDAANIKTLKEIVSFDEPTAENLAAAAAAGIKLTKFTDLAAGSSPAVEPADVSPDDLAYVMYTSGTTGDPKGVMLTQRNLIASSASLILAGFDLGPTDVYLSYLPLAHCFEACVQIAAICAQAAIGFYQGDAKLLIDDVAVLKPTVFAGVPRVYSRIYDRVQSVVASSGWIKQHVFNTAFQSQLEYVRLGQRNALLDKLVFNKVAQQLGGRVRIMATGAAPMPAYLMDFLKVAFKCGVFQGYGMTENAAAAMVTPPGYLGVGTVGGPLVCTEVKLADVPEMGYFATNDPPGGEVCLRGPNVFKGYFKLDKETKEALDEQGWLHTGDIGVWEPDTSLRIVDRKKNIFKLAQGEFVAAEELENIFGKSSYICQIFVYGNSFKVNLVAVVVPSVDQVMVWAGQHGIAGSFKEVCATPQLMELLKKEIETLGKAAKLAGFKFPKALHIESEINALGQGFTIETDTLTPTFKLRRPQLLKRYQGQIDRMYSELDAAEKRAADRG